MGAWGACRPAGPLMDAAMRHAASPSWRVPQATWLEWGEADKTRGLAQSSADIPAMEVLFDRAVKDYLSIALWTQYLE